MRVNRIAPPQGEHDCILLNLTNIRHTDLFVRLQKEARENSRGLWSPDTCDGDA